MTEDTPHRPTNTGSRQRKIYSVTELNVEIKTILEDRFPFVWLVGEISNFRIPASGHFYFTIKDSASQISAVMFRGQQRQLKFAPEDGMSITGMGRVGVYEPRGTYQIILEYMEPSGAGALQIAFDQLKKRLAAEGLFDNQLKRRLPLIPQKISVVTSPSGAVVHDILQTIDRRFPNVQIQIIPVKVQGPGAIAQIVAALSLVNAAAEADVVVLARGGGSLEDLQAFNSEEVARAIFACRVPVVSAVGHETDYTIADFVADLRAPTPTAAAEMIVPPKLELQRHCRDLALRLNSKIDNYFRLLNSTLNGLVNRLKDPRRQLQDHRLRLDDLYTRLTATLDRQIRHEREYFQFWRHRLDAKQPRLAVEKYKKKLEYLNGKLINSLIIFTQIKTIRIRELTAKLEALNPLAILARGYSIIRTIPDATVVTNSQVVALNQELEVMLAKGRLICQVKGKANDGQKNL